MLKVVLSLFDCCVEDATGAIVVGGDATEFLSERCQLEPLESSQALVRLLDFGRSLMVLFLIFIMHQVRLLHQGPHHVLIM
jgi:hypothetical protein